MDSATVDTFVRSSTGQCLDLDHAFGCQCVDLADAWGLYLGHGLPLVPAAKDFAGRIVPGWDWTPNTPAGVPQPGDLVVWGTLIGPFGHVALRTTGPADTSTFQTLDQNWFNTSDMGSPAALVTHTYYGVLGWLHPQTTQSGGGAVNSVDIIVTGFVDRAHAGVGTDKATWFDAPNGSALGALPADATALTYYHAEFDGVNWWDKVVNHFDGTTPVGSWWMLDSFLNTGGKNPLQLWQEQQAQQPPAPPPVPPTPPNVSTIADQLRSLAHQLDGK